MTWKPPESVRIGPSQRMKRVQPAEPRHPLGGRAEHQVVGVAQQDVGAGLAHLIGGQRLDRAGGADRHEGRRAHLAMRAVTSTPVRAAPSRAPMRKARPSSAARQSRQASP